MDLKEDKEIQLQNFQPPEDSFLVDVIEGLKKKQKELLAKYFYDEKGSDLFKRICTLDEYYIPRVETSIMEENIDEITAMLGENIIFIEYGCGDCAKTRILINHLKNPLAFIPIDISGEQLVCTADKLAAEYPELKVLPVCADYTNKFSLPIKGYKNSRKVVYFPGSSIGNFAPAEAEGFLKRIAGVCGINGMLLIGIDLKKDMEVLNNAYNDGEGVTAAFNFNLLMRINRELGADFNAEHFRHHAFYNQEKGRVEMHLISLKKQVVHLGGIAFPFKEGETIWTESSYKYGAEEFAAMANAAGFRLMKSWADEKQWFSVQCLVRVK